MDASIKLLMKQVAGSDGSNEASDVLKHKIEETDASIKLLRKQVAENDANDKTGCNAARMRAIAQGKKKQKELTDEQGDAGNESLRLHASGQRPAGLVQAREGIDGVRSSPTCGRCVQEANQPRSGVRPELSVLEVA